MNLRLQKEHLGKVVLIGTSILMWLLIIVLFNVYGYEETWQLWKVPTWTPAFLDFRLIPGSAESFAHGYEPTVENPYDPTERIFNYPAFWRLFFYTGITQADTVWISITMIVLFFISAFSFPGKLSVPAAIAMLFVLFSPASMLLYERGNVDLIVFFICVMSILAASYSTYAAAVLTVFGAIVKLFPILGLSIFLGESKKKFLRLSAVSSLVVLVYMIATWDSVTASWNLTMRGDGASYGTNILVTRYGEAISIVFSRWFSTPQVAWLIKYGSLAIALVLVLVVLILAFKDNKQPHIHSERNLAAFRMGASIYVGTFLLGNNWDYRLAFLVLVVPQLLDWMQSGNGKYRAIALFSMIAVLISCWHFWIYEISLVSLLDTVRNSRKFWIILDETFNWMLFASLGYLLFVSTPAWIKDQMGSWFPKRNPYQSRIKETS